MNISAEIIFFDEPQNSFFIANTETATSSSEGGILGSVGRWFSKKLECKKDSDCSIGKYCDNSKCYKYECNFNSECEEGEICWEKKCIRVSGTTISFSESLNKESIILLAIILCVLFYIMYIRKRRTRLSKNL